MLNKIFTLLCFSFLFFNLNAQVVITDADLGTETYTWTKDNVYLLDGNVFLEAGGVLNIEAGTVIKAKTTPTSNDISSSLIIARGAQIFAVGTRAEPIIFTAELDDLSVTNDFTAIDNMQWGGLIVCGNSIVGEDGGTDQVEGIPTDDTRGEYGGTDANDNSGVIKYVSIRHGGAVLGADNEIQGLTLAGVGAGTTIDYVEIFANNDDGIEFFGGTVNATHIIAAFTADDSFDFDESWNGYCQFLFSFQGNELEDLGDNAIEYDGTEATSGVPNETGRIYNGTFIGSGASGNANSDGLRLKSAGRVELWNSVFYQPTGYVFRVEDDAILGVAAGESAFAGNVAFEFGTLVQDDVPEITAALTASAVTEINPEIASVSRTTDGALDPRPADFNSPIYGGAAQHTATDAVNTQYRGAFEWSAASETTWAHGWTALDAYGYLYSTGFTSSTDDVTEGAFELAVQPNPVTDLAQIAFELPNASDVELTMVDLQGRAVYSENLGMMMTGQNNVTLNISTIAQGLYVVIVKTNAGTATRKIVKQ